MMVRGSTKVKVSFMPRVEQKRVVRVWVVRGRGRRKDDLVDGAKVDRSK